VNAPWWMVCSSKEMVIQHVQVKFQTYLFAQVSSKQYLIPCMLYLIEKNKERVELKGCVFNIMNTYPSS